MAQQIKGTCHQAWKPEINSQDLHDRRRADSQKLHSNLHTWAHQINKSKEQFLEKKVELCQALL